MKKKKNEPIIQMNELDHSDTNRERGWLRSRRLHITQIFFKHTLGFTIGRSVSKSLKCLDDDEVAIVKDVWILQGLDSAAAKEVLFHSFGLEDSIFVLKLRNSQGSLIPINSALNINSKQSPYILEVVKLFQHVVPKRRNAVLTVTSKSLKNRLQSIMKRIDRLDELGPEISMKWKNKLSKEMGLLNQKLQFLDQRMQATSSNLVYCASLECGSIISQLNFLSRTLQDNSDLKMPSLI
ncbi:uncharacterized protein [Narcine bancroftii]|uniref:uncharacterized protein isoform X3 n=1 Tax=Narcine bancroftii TaxID=1343680 RepID=UPI0038319B01